MYSVIRTTKGKGVPITQRNSIRVVGGDPQAKLRIPSGVSLSSSGRVLALDPERLVDLDERFELGVLLEEDVALEEVGQCLGELVLGECLRGDREDLVELLERELLCLGEEEEDEHIQ